MTSLPQAHTSIIQTPSLDNASVRDWEAHSQLAYYFARHARHDLANIHCALGMLEMVEQIQADHPQTPLPEELNLENIRTKSRMDVKKVISISNDLILLSQAASHAPYQAMQSTSLREIVEQQITCRLTNHEHQPLSLLEQLDNIRVVAMGDMLGVALCAFYCQWSPWAQSHANAAQATVQINARQIALHIPADDLESVSQFAQQLDATREDEPLSLPLQQCLTTSTCTMALWLARHIIIVHGGSVSIDPNHPQDSLTIYLPKVN